MSRLFCDSNEETILKQFANLYDDDCESGTYFISVAFVPVSQLSDADFRDSFIGDLLLDAGYFYNSLESCVDAIKSWRISMSGVEHCVFRVTLNTDLRKLMKDAGSNVWYLSGKGWSLEEHAQSLRGICEGRYDVQPDFLVVGLEGLRIEQLPGTALDANVIRS